eukprot:1159327-Pelagomonas_calceolata.AAC.2
MPNVHPWSIEGLTTWARHKATDMERSTSSSGRCREACVLWADGSSSNGYGCACIELLSLNQRLPHAHAEIIWRTQML